MGRLVQSNEKKLFALYLPVQPVVGSELPSAGTQDMVFGKKMKVYVPFYRLALIVF